jgi:hypothetical protein
MMVMHVISATHEAEIGGWQFEVNPGKSLQDLTSKNKLLLVAHVYNHSSSEGRGWKVKAKAQAKTQDPV